MVDAATGELIWGVAFPTTHIHAEGLCADIDPKTPGCEVYSGEENRSQAWLHDAKGNLLKKGDLTSGNRPVLHPRVAWWDGSPQKSILNTRTGRLVSYPSMQPVAPFELEGDLIQIADIFGDWREEIIMVLPGELRIYTTTTPARNRRVTLLRDPNYRATMYESAMGHPQDPLPMD